ncbi:hypothetical protein KFL_004100040 [Klebsormidium nitens]|uniref:Amidase domain-containing protein n=1 Tax=Klebsormidium nitens TaxID=105231 RepID=A0A1Y1IHJ6_KLENI|nr:hypothetical protein KFL_004100040 [Klebsormidium nitens]|eukprot:GAQ88216.1 hypothetical protein KFL_004100040 [Klebsormidium nitens]
MAVIKAVPLLLLLALTSSVSAGRVLLQSCPSTCYTASGSTGYCCPSGFNCFSSDTFTCYPASASYPSDPSTAVSNGFTAGSTPAPTTGSPGPAGSPPTESPVAPGPAPAGTDSNAIGIPLSGGSCTSSAYPSTCTTADGSAQYCCPTGTGCFSSSTFTCYSLSAGTYPSGPTSFDCSKIIELTIDDAQALFKTGELTSRLLVSCYLQRIADYDNIGTFKGLTAYATNAVLELNPTALADADAKDIERAACAPNCNLNKLHGIPVALKDNVCADGMECTAGSWNLFGSVHEEAYLTTGIKNAGGIILCKLGLSEWANYRGSSVSGWSGRGGQVYNPYVRYSISGQLIVRNPYPEIPSVFPDNTTFVNYTNPTIVSGSSSGSGVAAAANLAMVTIGSETSGSILGPSGANGIVGIKPTVGLVSRAGVIPLSESQDTAGPMCRTVADAVYLLDATTGVDPKDSYTAGQVVPAGGFAQFLKTTGLQGKKIAFLPLNPNTTNSATLEGYNAIPDILRAQGATVDELPFPFTIPGTANLGTGGTGGILSTDFKVNINQFLSELSWKPGFTVQKTLADMIQFNKDNYLLEFQGGTCCRGEPAYGNFFQQTWESSQNTTGFSNPNYISAKQNASAVAAGITSFLDGNGYDAITSTGGLTGTFATAQFPSISVPGLKSSLGSPVGFVFHGVRYSEAKLIEMAYAYEQAKPFPRPIPTYCNGASC